MSKIVPAEFTWVLVPTAVEAISEIFPLESIKLIRANALFTFQTIPASVAEDLTKPPRPSMVRTTSLFVGLLAKTY